MKPKEDLAIVIGGGGPPKGRMGMGGPMMGHGGGDQEGEEEDNYESEAVQANISRLIQALGIDPAGVDMHEVSSAFKDLLEVCM